MFKLVLIFALFSVAFAKSTSGEASFNDDGEFGISTKGNWMSLQWATLSEVDSTGAVVQSVDLSKHHYGWSQAEVTPVLANDGRDTGDRLPGVNVSVQLENGALFNVTAWILDDNANSSSGKRGDVKFSIFISNWTFVGPRNGAGEGQGTHLVLTAGLAGFGGMVRSSQNKAKNGNGTTTDLVFGAGYLNSPTDGLYDGVSDTVSVSNSEHGKPVVMWTFRRFDQNVSYDPLFGSSGANIVPSALSIFVMALALIKLF
jgi:hypothetical protein